MSSESLHPVTDGSRCRNLQPSTRPSYRSPVEENKRDLMNQGIKVITREPTENTNLGSYKLYGPTAREPAWD